MKPVARVDIKGIQSESKTQIARRHNGIRLQLSRMERATIKWTQDVRGNWPDAAFSFRMPLAGRLKLEFYELYVEAAGFGALHVAKENKGTRRANVLPKSRTRGAGAAQLMISRMEVTLIDSWVRSTHRRSTQREIDYYTRLAFSKFGGWDPPEAP